MYKPNPLRSDPKPEPKAKKKKKPINKVSKSRESQNESYKLINRAYLLKNPLCLAKVSPDCDKKSCCTHHKKGKIGDLLCDTRYFLACCLPCHSWIEAHPDLAKERGLSVNRLDV